MQGIQGQLRMAATFWVSRKGCASVLVVYQQAKSEMKRMVSNGIAVTVLAVLAMSGPAAAFTPVPIPTPRRDGPVAATVAHDQAPVILET